MAADKHRRKRAGKKPAPSQAPAPAPEAGPEEREAARIFAVAADLHRRRQLGQAIREYSRAILLNPRHADAYNNLGVALRGQGQFAAAVACYRRALALRPDAPNVYSNMGNALRDLGRFEAAAEALRQALRLSPDSPEYRYNLGLVHRDMGRSDRALASFDKVIEALPDHAECHWDRALTHLRRGDYRRGFAEYEWRWKLGRSPPRGFPQPRWDGKPFAGKTLLVHWEQGFGDTIQFVRYLPMVKKLGGTVVLECQTDLARLLASADGVDRLVASGGPLADFDLHVPLMSLPWLLETTPATVPAKTPYLVAPSTGGEVVPTLDPGALKIAVAWAGSATNRDDRRRTCPFAHFLELAGVPGITLYSIQRGKAADDLRAGLGGPLVFDLGRACKDFADNAARLAQMDLVISVDTAIAHLAGALGKPVWTLLSATCDWRWRDKGERTPWYPTMRLFRQKTLGDWDGLFARVRVELAKVARVRHAARRAFARRDA